MMMFAACTDDNILDEGGIQILPDAPVDGVVKMHMTAADADRVEYLPVTRGFYKWQKLEWVATITNPKVQGSDRVWSATAIAIDDKNHKAYITWHSDRQAKNQAQVWGGAIDEVDITDESARRIFLRRTGTNNLLKYNNVLLHNGKLYLSATSALVGGTVGRIDLNNFNSDDVDVELIGFPGTSVNAVAPMNDGETLIGISGYDPGAYASFPADIEKKEEFLKSSKITILNNNDQTVVDNFGGKYATTDENGDVYILYDPLDEKVQIKKIGDQNIELDIDDLISGEKYAETYSEAGGWKPLEGETATHYGKHALAVRNGYAYVGAGKGTGSTGTGEKVDEKGGLRVYDLKTGDLVWYNNTYTTGVYADSNYVYAATGAGLRIYSLYNETAKEDTLFAYEVENYAEGELDSGEPVGNKTAEISTAKRHSPNFVVAHRNYRDGGIYIYIAYGQSGVRVYRFRTEPDDEDPGESTLPEDSTIVQWAENNMPDGYFAFGELFCDEDDWNKNTTIISQIDSSTIEMQTYYARIKSEYEGSKEWSLDYWPNKSLGTQGKGYYDDHTQKYYRKGTGGIYYLDSIVYRTEAGDSILKPECDAAQVRLGNGWRIPTKEEWEDLLKYVGLMKDDGTADKSACKERFIPQFLPNKAGVYRWVFRLYPHNDSETYKNNYIDFPCNGHYEGGDIAQAWNKGNWCKNHYDAAGNPLHAWTYVSQVNQNSTPEEIEKVNKSLRDKGFNKLNDEFYCDKLEWAAGNDDSPECNYWTSTLYSSGNAAGQNPKGYAVELESFRGGPHEHMVKDEELWKGLQLRPVREWEWKEVGEIEPEKQPVTP